MTEFKDETPMAVLLEQMQRYNRKQMLILHGDPVKDGFSVNANELKRLYDHAYKINDMDVIALLVNKYDMVELFKDPDDSLPETTESETKDAFDDIYNMINSINPNDDIEKVKAAHRKRYKPDGTYRPRRYGGKFYRKMFRTDRNGNVSFSMDAYMYSLSMSDLKHMWYVYHPRQSTLYDMPHITITGMVGLLHNDDRTPDLLLKHMREQTYHPMPMEDILDMEKGIIAMG